MKIFDRNDASDYITETDKQAEIQAKMLMERNTKHSIQDPARKERNNACHIVRVHLNVKTDNKRSSEGVLRSPNKRETV